MSTRHVTLQVIDCDDCGKQGIRRTEHVRGTKDKHICRDCREERACRIFGHIPSTSTGPFPSLAGEYCTRCWDDLPEATR